MPKDNRERSRAKNWDAKLGTDYGRKIGDGRAGEAEACAGGSPARRIDCSRRQREANCVTARWGGEQASLNGQAAMQMNH